MSETLLEKAIRFGEDAYKRSPNRIDHYAGIHPDMLRILIDAAKRQNENKERKMTTINPIRVDWNKHDLAEAYDLVEGVRRAAAQGPDNPIDTSLCAALDAIEAADCEWDGMTKE